MSRALVVWLRLSWLSESRCPMSRALAILKEVFGYHAFRGRQGEIIDHVAEGGDCLVLMPVAASRSATRFPRCSGSRQATAWVSSYRH